MAMTQTPATKQPLIAALCAALLAAVTCSSSSAAPLAIADVPVFLNATNAEPLVMLALSNDEQLYHKAYTDFDDVDGDGVIDSTYKDTINYYGYFDPAKCYSYSGAVDTGSFAPAALASGHNCNGASGGGRWSGNFLNWATMTRVDALRKVLYGGYRSTDTSSSTYLERAYVPSDNHAWTKFYSASDLANYTPYDIGTYPNGITMCNVTPPDSSNHPSETTTTSPRVRIAKGQFSDWAAQESKQCLWYSTSASENEFTPNSANPGASPNVANGDEISEFTVRVQVCNSSLLGSEKCKTYGSNSSKPVGLLQDFADADQLKIRFGLMTGTYGRRKSGGELRKNIARFTDEVNPADGTFTGSAGIVKSINLMRISRYSYSDPGYGGVDGCPSGQNTWTNGKCSDWGNPVGEMFLEALRYFVAGKTPNSNFTSDDTPWIANLTSPSWVNPYGAASTAPVGGGGSSCAKPNILPISTGVVSFDNDEYSTASDIPGLSASALNSQTDSVGSNEGISGQSWYVGSLTGGSASDVCSAQTVNSLSAVTGICPEAAGLQGSFQVAGLAYYAHQHSLQTVSGKATPPVDTYAVSLAPPTPSLKIPVGRSTVTLIPAGYNLRNSNAMQLINFRVISQATDNSSGVYFMNFENAPAGSDYDNDMKGYMAYTVSGGTLRVTMWETGSSAGATQTMGYTISGVTDPGTYYLVSNTNSFTVNDATSKFFSTTATAIDAACKAAGFPGTGANEYGVAAPGGPGCHYSVADTGGTALSRYMRGIKSHTAGTSNVGLLKQPLWYAAKYGGFKDLDGDHKPSTVNEWDTNGDGVPDNYFFVTNPSQLGTQLANAFNAILAHSGSASSASVNSGSITSATRVYQAKFDTASWAGELLAYTIQTDGTIGATPNWNAAQIMPAPASRNILTVGSAGTGIPFRWTNLGTLQPLLYPNSGETATLGQQRLDYLRGDRSNEQANAGGFRNRSTILGDIVNSSPFYVAAPRARYSDSLESIPYSSFRTANVGRTPAVYVGANDGMLHAFNATTSSDPTQPDPPAAGKEMFAFIPTALLPNLYQLTSPTYSHLYYADGTPTVVDAFYAGAWHTVLVAGLNKGGREMYALDVTDPATVTEATASTKVLWEFTSAQDVDLGYTFSRPSIVRLHNGKWAAIFGNGYNGTGTGHAVLFILDIQTGAVIAKIDTKQGAAGTPNGLAPPAAVDVDGDGIVDYVYAGDLLGNMWKFDLTSTSASSWGVAYTAASNPAPLFTAKDGTTAHNPQPITERPQIGYGPGGQGLVVLFGTGKFIEASDRTVDQTNQRPQSFYGIFDANTGGNSDIVTARGVSGFALQAQTIDYEGPVTVSGVDSSGNPTTLSYNIRIVSTNKVNTVSQHGWYIDLVSPHGYEAEKQISDPILRNGKIIFTTTIPDADVCAYGGRSWLMEMDSLTGGALQYTPFDLNGDKNFNDSDFVTVTLPNGTTEKVPASGTQSTDGLLTKPGIVVDQKGAAEYKVTPDSSGKLEVTRENPGPGAIGRQSWRQLR
jgi:type IV pilus assembly protein PilY1